MMEDENNLPKLPKSWVWTKLVDACQYLPTGVEKFDENVEYYSTGSIQSNSYVLEGVYSFSKRPSRANRMVKKRDILQARMAGTNKALLIGEELDGKLFSTGFIQLRPFNCCVGMSSYIYYYIRSPVFINQRDTLATGSTQVALTDNAAQHIYFPLAPLPEQRRIVVKIEKQFTKLDAGVEELKKVKSQLKRYRQSILKHAFEGKLTEGWREAHKGEIEPASLLLERIKKERKKKAGWEYKKLPPLDMSDLPELPKGWMWTILGEISESMKNGIYRPRKFYGDTGTACLRMYNIENGSIVWTDIKRMNLTSEEIEEYKLQPDDIIVNRVNSRELVGKAAVIPVGLETCVYESKNIRLRLYGEHVGSKYINFWFLLYRQRYFNRHAQQTVGMASINQKQLGSMPIPIPSATEQHKIVEEIERRFSSADEVEKVVEQSLKRAERLRQSILKRAFEGKLAPQDQSDEPAEKLLERIKAEKEKRGAVGKEKRRKRTRKRRS